MKALNAHRHEKGQILLILTVGIVALLGMVALAVDGGMIYADRRFDQNAADASALAGAGAAAQHLEAENFDSNKFDCSGAFLASKEPNPSHDLHGTIIAARNAALLQAASNNFSISYPLANQHGLDIVCVSSGKTRYLEVRTVISTTVQTAFAHLFYKGEVRNTVEAVARVNVAAGIGGGGVLTHLNTDCDSPLLFAANSNNVAQVFVDGASSNGCIRKNGDPIIYSPVQDPTKRIPIKYLDTCKKFLQGNKDGCPANGEWHANFAKIAEPVQKYYLEELRTGINNMTKAQVKQHWDGICGPKITKKGFKDGEVMSPGTYESVSITGNGKPVIMQSGLYCVESDFHINASLKSEDGGVTIIMLENGKFTITGNPLINLKPTQTGDFANLLLYAQKYNTKPMQFGGSPESTFEGTIWAPDGQVVFNGTGNTDSFDIQIIADQISLYGNSSMNLRYAKDKVWTAPSTVSFIK
jgi:hypothetical protein